MKLADRLRRLEGGQIAYSEVPGDEEVAAAQRRSSLRMVRRIIALGAKGSGSPAPPAHPDDEPGLVARDNALLEGLTRAEYARQGRDYNAEMAVRRSEPCAELVLIARLRAELRASQAAPLASPSESEPPAAEPREQAP